MRKAAEFLAELRKSDPRSPGLQWLNTLLIAHGGDEEGALRAVAGIPRDGMPDWLCSNLIALERSLGAAKSLPRRPSEHPDHQELTKGLSCPLLRVVNGQPRCLASRSEDAPTEAAQQALCSGQLWQECPHFVCCRNRFQANRMRTAAAEAALTLADEALDNGQFAEVVRICQEGVRKEPLEDNFYYLWRLAMRSMRQFQEGYRCMAVAGEVRPAEPGIPAMAAALALEMGKPQLAEVCARHAVALKSGHAVSLNNLAEALRAQGRRGEAVDYFHRAVQAQPDNLDFRHSLMISLGWLGRFEEAQKEVEEIKSRLGGQERWSEDFAQLAQHARLSAALAKEAEQRLAALGPPAQALGNLSSPQAIAEYAQDLLICRHYAEYQSLVERAAPSMGRYLPLLEGLSLYYRRERLADLRKAAALFEDALSGLQTDLQPWRGSAWQSHGPIFSWATTKRR